MSAQRWNARLYRERAGFVASMATDLVDQLNPHADETILDLGCGDGELTAKIARRGCRVIGVDASADMVHATGERGIEAHVADARELPYRETFDAVFSNAVLHWIMPPERPLKAVYGALKPGGRFIAELGGEGNVETIVNAMEGVFRENPRWGKLNTPWFFPSVAFYRALLQQTGFEVLQCKRFSRPTLLPDGIRAWLEIFTNGVSGHLNSEQKAVFYSRMEEKLASQLLSEQGWMADYVRLRFVAVKV